ncbi:MAG: TIGR03435 family protein, partial [Edaphobacter sp.]
MTERIVLNFRRGLVLAVAAGCLGVATTNMLGQAGAAAETATTTDGKVPAFDVVSVKQNKSESRMVRVMNKSDGYAATNVSLKMLLQGAYGIREDLISGAPGWADSAHFDIDAKVADADVDTLKNLKSEQRRLMLQPLLADRFHLKAHTETKLLPVYELALAKGGSKLKESTPGDTYANGIKGFDGVGDAGMMMMGRGEATGQAISISGMVNMLSRQ